LPLPKAPRGGFTMMGSRQCICLKRRKGAMGYYTHADSPAQILNALTLSNARILDLRDPAQYPRFGSDPENANNRRQNERAECLPASRHG